MFVKFWITIIPFILLLWPKYYWINPLFHVYDRDFNKRLGSAGPAALGGRPRSLESGDEVDAINIQEERTGRNSVGLGMLLYGQN